MQQRAFAHSLPGRPLSDWEPLGHHLGAVGVRAGEFAEPFGFREAAQAAGRLHDIGKASRAFFEYISTPREDLDGRKGPDHSTAGAREAMRLYGARSPPLGRMLAYAIAGHHAGLADPADLARRLDPDQTKLEDYAGWEAHAGALPQMADMAPTKGLIESPVKGFSKAFLTRMLFSCLVDADFLETEAFYAEAENQTVERGSDTSPTDLRDRLDRYMRRLGEGASATPVNALRAQVLAHAKEKASLSPGLFTLTVPTGGGKTLASLSFALDHAVHHGLRRVVYVIPFTSIIEQTAQVFREALDTRDDVLEHHASFDWDHARDVRVADQEGPGGIDKLRRAAENWDAPVVVTTAVQFFESLFAARTSPCHKLHNLAGAVIVLDEAQSLPLAVLRPCLAALDELARNYGCSVVLCTATQPAWRRIDGALVDKAGRAFGLDVGAERELAPDPPALYRALKRVEVEVLPGETADETIVDRFAEQERMLCIVNSRAHARSLYEAIRDQSGAVHLTTLMCPRHRQAVLAEVRRKLAMNAPVRLVATSLIEAGVDVDFPEVWRAAAGLESIAQAAGRCNREGKLAMGRTVVFTPADAKPPHELEAFWQAARPVLRRGGDPLSLEAVTEYFRQLYWQKGDDALDATIIGDGADGRRGVLPALAERAGDGGFPFRSVAEAFRLIQDVMVPVIVPWDETARECLATLAAMDRPTRAILQTLQGYVVSIPRRARDEWLRLGALQAAHPSLGDTLLRFADDAHYHADTGLDLGDIHARAPGANLIGP